VVAHFDVAFFIHQSDEVSFPDFPAGVGGSENGAVLLIVKQRFFGGFAIVGITDGAEGSVVVVHGVKKVNSTWIWIIHLEVRRTSRLDSSFLLSQTPKGIF
jgi:hypothetical protein